MQIRSVCAARGLVLSLAVLCAAACATPAHDGARRARLVHDVYFTLAEPSPAACAALVDACYAQLAGIDDVLFLVAGTRDRELLRDVNDLAYDVSLHVYFESRAAHDAYQTAPAHVAFVAAQRAGWKQVRVFDSLVADR